jgi:hypothetical protein
MLNPVCWTARMCDWIAGVLRKRAAKVEASNPDSPSLNHPRCEIFHDPSRPRPLANATRQSYGAQMGQVSALDSYFSAYPLSRRT